MSGLYAYCFLPLSGAAQLFKFVKTEVGVMAVGEGKAIKAPALFWFPTKHVSLAGDRGAHVRGCGSRRCRGRPDRERSDERRVFEDDTWRRGRI